MTLSKLRVVLEASTGQFNRAMKATGAAFKKTGNAARGLASRMLSLKNVFKVVIGAVIIRQIAAVTKAIFDLGASVEETESKFRTVFGTSSGGVQKFLDEFATSAGLSNRAAQDLVATTAAMIQGMGSTQVASAAMAEQVLRLAADLASFNDLPTAETLNAVQSALAGEREQLKRLGIVIREVDVQQRALTLSGKESAKALTQQEKVLATIELLYEKAGVAVGDLSRTHDSAANTARRLGARIENLKEKFSTGLMPVMSVLLGTVADNSTAFDALNSAIEIMSNFTVTAVAMIQILGSEIAALTPRLQLFAVVVRESMANALMGMGLPGLAAAVRPEIEQIILALEDFEGRMQRARDAADEMARVIIDRMLIALKQAGQAAGSGSGGAARSIGEFREQLELTKDQMPPVIEQFRLLSVNVGAIPRAAEDARRSMGALDDAVVGFALDFGDSLARATAEGAAAFDGFVNRVLQGLARIAAQIVVFNALKSIFPTSGVVSQLGAVLGIAATTSGSKPSAVTVGGSGAKLMAGGTVFNQNVIFNISALDGPSVAEVIRSQKGTIASVVAEAAQESSALRRALR